LKSCGKSKNACLSRTVRKVQYQFLMDLKNHPVESTTGSNAAAQTQKDTEISQSSEQFDSLALFRLLTREPPSDHDFRTCPICTRYGITEI